MRVLIVGDVHGRHPALLALLRRVQSDYRIGAAIQVGDFGFDAEAMAREATLRYPVPLHVIEGNHEDHGWLYRAHRSGLTSAWATDANLIYQPRGSVAAIGGTTFGFLGGALHVDQPQRQSLLQRSPNFITRRQREQATATFNRARPELIVTHSCPSRIGIGMTTSAEHAAGVDQHIRGAGFDAGPPDDCGDAELTRLWQALAYRPRLWLFGHFHRDHAATIDGVRFQCIGADLDCPTHQLTLYDTAASQLLRVPLDPSVG